MVIGEYNTVDIFDADTGLWSVATLSSARGWLAGTTLDDYALFAGGGNGRPYRSTLDIYDEGTGQWSTDSLSAARHSPVATSVGNYALFAGGFDNTANASNVVDIYSVPEPPTLALLGIGAISLLACAWRRRKQLHNLRSMILAAMMVLAAGSAQADVFNMGGTRDTTTGTWTGAASLEFVTVGDPGNAADTQVMTTDGTTGYGSVPYVYQIGKYDVTAGQYTAFLNAVAKTDPYGLYDSGMAKVGSYLQNGTYGCGIVRSGSSGGYAYTVATAYQNFPVNYVSWGDATRFCNWLQNGQPVGPESDGTTENGALRDPWRYLGVGPAGDRTQFWSHLRCPL